MRRAPAGPQPEPENAAGGEAEAVVGRLAVDQKPRAGSDRRVGYAGSVAAAFFAGNACWWRVRIDDDGQAMWCYKEAALDPESDPSLQTVNWPDPLAAELTGVA